MLLKAIASAFDLSIVRARSALKAATFHFAFVGSVTALKSATNALYLARRDPHDLPYLYLATALVVTVVTAFVGKRLADTSAKPILRQSLLFSGVVLLVLSSLALADVRFSLGVLYVFGEAYATALSVLFWSRLGEVYDVRAGKRVFGAIAAAGMAGAVVGGLLVKGFAHDLPREVWCFTGGATLFFLRPLIGRERASATIKRERVAFREGLRFAANSNFSRGVALLVLLLSVETAAIDYAFRTGSVRASSGNEASMAALFGVINAVVGAIAIVFQATATAPFLRRLGVFAFLSIIPFCCVIAGGWAFLSPGEFAPLFALKTLEMIGSFSLYQPGLQLLYNPMPTAVRGSVRAVIDGSVRKLGGAVGGVLLLLLGSLLGPELLIAMVVVLGVGILAWIRFITPLYIHALEQKLGGKEDVQIPVIDPSDRATRHELIRALKDRDPGKTLAALSVLEHHSGFDPREHISALISHPAEAVRLKAIDLIERAPDRAHVPFLISVIRSEGKHPKAQAARALMLIDPTRGREVLEPVLTSFDGTGDETGLAAAVIAAFLGTDRERFDDNEGARELANLALLQMLERGHEASEGERRELARLLGMLGPGPYAHRLAEYLADPNTAVRKAAIEAASKARDDRLPPLLVKKLGDRSVQRAVSDSLAGYGDSVVPMLATMLDDRRVELAVRVQVPRTLRKIASTEAANVMLYSNIHDDAYLRYTIIEELVRMKRANPELEFDRQHTEGAVLRRLRAYAHYRPIALDLASGGPPFRLLHRAAQDRVRQNLQAALRVLGLLYDLSAMENAGRGLLMGDRSSHADAVEIVDVALRGSGIREQVLEHLEPRNVPVSSTLDAEERARELIDGRDVMLAMVAAQTLRKLGKDAPDPREPTSGEPLMPRSIIERVFLLQDVQLFRGLSVDDLAAVAAVATEGHAQPNQVVYAEGVPGDSMHVIISGEIHLLHGGRTLIDLHAGEAFGQTSILDGGPRPVTAKAGDEGVDFVRIERQAFMDLMVDRPELMNGLFVELGERIRELIALTETGNKSEQKAGSTGSLRATESQAPLPR